MCVAGLFYSVADIGNPYSLDVFEGHVYWTTKERGEVWKANKFGQGNKVKVLTINPWLTQVRIYQEHRHNQSGQNPMGLKHFLHSRRERVHTLITDTAEID